MVIQGLFGFASSLVIAVVAIAGVCYTVNYIHSQFAHQEQGPSRPSTSSNNKSKSWKGYDDWNEISCTICLTSVSNGPSKRELECGHMFHKKCIEGWFSHTRCCPNCRKDVQ